MSILGQVLASSIEGVNEHPSSGENIVLKIELKIAVCDLVLKMAAPAGVCGLKGRKSASKNGPGFFLLVFCHRVAPEGAFLVVQPTIQGRQDQQPLRLSVFEFSRCFFVGFKFPGESGDTAGIYLVLLQF